MPRVLLIIGLAVVAVVLAAVYLPSSAATVGGTTISRQSLDSDLSAISSSPDYACFLSEERQLSGGAAVPVVGAGTSSTAGGVYNSAFVDDWLSSMVVDQVVVQALSRKDVRLTSADLATGRAVLERRIESVLDDYADNSDGVPSCGGSGTAVLASLPGWFSDQQAHAETAEALLDARAAGSGLGAAALDAYYTHHAATFDKLCVSVIVVRTTASAKAAAAAIAGGTSFATEAAAVSITSNTAANGGVAGCGMVDGTFLSKPLVALPIDTPSAPFSGEGVYWLAEVTSRTTEALSAVKSSVVTAIIDAGQARADRELAAAVKRAAISVDPRYGTSVSGTLTVVRPPSSPPLTTLLSPAAAQPPTTTPA